MDDIDEDVKDGIKYYNYSFSVFCVVQIELKYFEEFHY